MVTNVGDWQIGLPRVVLSVARRIPRHFHTDAHSRAGAEVGNIEVLPRRERSRPGRCGPGVLERAYLAVAAATRARVGLSRRLHTGGMRVTVNAGESRESTGWRLSSLTVTRRKYLPGSGGYGTH